MKEGGTTGGDGDEGECGSAMLDCVVCVVRRSPFFGWHGGVFVYRQDRYGARLMYNDRRVKAEDQLEVSPWAIWWSWRGGVEAALCCVCGNLCR